MLEYGRIHVNKVLDKIYGLCFEQSQPSIARDTGFSRATVKKFLVLAQKNAGYLRMYHYLQLKKLAKRFLLQKLKLKETINHHAILSLLLYL